jgi:hypothetical protein
LEKFEYIQPSAIIYKNYRDRVVMPHTDTDAVRTINSVVDGSIAWPAVFVGFATTDVTNTLGDGTDEVDSADTFTYDIAQSFTSLGEAIIGCKFYYYCPSLTGTLRVSLQLDNGNNAPNGVTLAYVDTAVSAGPRVLVTADFTTASVPIQVAKGRKCWLIFQQTTHTCTCNLKAQDPIVGDSADYYVRPYTGGAWALSTTNKNILCDIHYANYDEVAPEDYYFDAGTSKIVVRLNGIPITTVDTYYTIYRGMVSYYYGTITTEDIFTKLVCYEGGVGVDLDPALVTTYSLYQTRGKSIGECFRELGDAYETTGTYSGYQHSICAKGVTIYFGFRPYAGDRTFAHGADSTTDDEIRINSVNLRRTINLRPASVMVIGKGATGAPIIVQRDDRALTTSFRTQSKMALLTTHTDESINTLADADRKAWQILDSFARGTWEGTITVAGVFPDLFDRDGASSTCGAGGSIHLKYSPLGIVNEQFHVKGIVLHENTTEIQISNEDVLALNALTDARGRAERSESFIAPDDPFSTVFVSGFSNNVVTDATLYAQLEKAEDTAIDGMTRVLCTRTSNSRYNDVTYHAEFAMENGYTIDGSTIVNRVALYTAAGLWITNIGLSFGEQFPKWRTTRVIAEIHCKAAA